MSVVSTVHRVILTPAGMVEVTLSRCSAHDGLLRAIHGGTPHADDSRVVIAGQDWADVIQYADGSQLWIPWDGSAEVNRCGCTHGMSN